MEKIRFLDVPPLDAIGGRIHLPGSKSISNRALLLAALSDGQTHITGTLVSDDTSVMLDALAALGCQIEIANPNHIEQGVSITGIGRSHGGLSSAPISLFLGNAGTVMRPLTAVTALLGGHYVLDGVARMRERPIGDLVDALRNLGCLIEYQQQEGFPPLKISPFQWDAQCFKKPIQVKGNVSSQFLSALLLALPLAAQEQDIVIEVIGELISKPYIAITLAMLADFGVHVRQEGFERFTIPAGSRYISPGNYAVEKDASSASYFIAAAAIAAQPENPLVIEGLGTASIQGDIRFIDAAAAMGAHIDAQAKELTISRGTFPLKAIDIDCNTIPDAAMTLAVMALYAQGTTKLRNIGSWRVKETDRLQAMKNELSKLGATVQIDGDSIEITPPAVFRTAAIETYDDHRIAMCFSLAVFNAQRLPVRLLDPACVNKTYPRYFDDFFSVTQASQQNIPVIAVDGPSASGKGTLASALAKELGYHYLDSGALYRVTAYAATRNSIDIEDVENLVRLAQTLPVSFDGQKVLYVQNGMTKDITNDIRAENIGIIASKIATYPDVRKALFVLQHSFWRAPGLVADGRDMGTIVFPHAQLKVFLTASAKARAQRRYKQLIEKGISAKIESLVADLQERDARDMSRAVAPLKAAQDAHLLDNSELDIMQSIQQVLSWWGDIRPFEGLSIHAKLLAQNSTANADK